MTGLDGKQNFDAIQDTELPAHIEKGILACLQVKRSHFTPEDVVKQQFRTLYKREIDDWMPPPVIMYTKKEDGSGKFEPHNMKDCYEADMAKYTKEYMSMSVRDRQIFDRQKQSRRELFEMKKKFAKSNITGDLNKLKQEAHNLDRDDEKKQKNRSFNKI